MKLLKSSLKKILTPDLLLPLGLILVYILFLIVIRGIVPTPEELINDFARLYARFGYEILFLSAFLEALVIVNLFVPGQIAMVMGVIFARSGVTQLPLVLLSVCLGAISGYLLDYLLGEFGFADVLKRLGYGHLLDQANNQLSKFGKKGLALGFIHTNIGAFLSLAAGTVNFSPLVFVLVAILATSFWAILWSILVYSVGDLFLLIIKKYSFLLILLVIGGLMLSRIGRRNVHR